MAREAASLEPLQVGTHGIDLFDRQTGGEERRGRRA
jgi:hypothetical protein